MYYSPPSTPIYVFFRRKLDQEEKDLWPKMCDNQCQWKLTESKPYILNIKFYFSSRQNIEPNNDWEKSNWTNVFEQLPKCKV